MCIAILNTKGILSLKTFKTCWEANPDGAGLCYFDGEKIQILKDMKGAKTFHKSYLAVREKFPSIDIAIHFRISTHGRVNVTNCHPFKVNKTTAFIHNGMINNVAVNPDFSDTYIFNETIVKSLPNNFVKNTAILELLANYIGYSKLVIISGENASIVNEELGLWDGGNWYSNKSYIPFVLKEVKPYGAHTTGAWEDWNGYGWSSAKGWAKGIDKTIKDEESAYFDSCTGCETNKADEVRGECECCREESDALKYHNNWGMLICAKCSEEFAAETY